MKLTESQLRKIIREQLKSILNEGERGGRIGMGSGFGGNVGMATEPTAPAKTEPSSEVPWNESQKERSIGNIGSDRSLADLERYGSMNVALNAEQIDWLLKHLGTSLEEVRKASRQRKDAESEKYWQERTKNWPPMGPSPTLGIK